MNSDHSKIFSKKRRRNPESGIALISVLWVLLLLSALAATSAYISRTNAVIVHRSLEFARVQEAADAAIVDTMRMLSDEQSARHGAVDGTTRAWSFDGIEVTIVVSNEAGRIDVNAADQELLFALLMSQGVPEDAGTDLLHDLRSWQHVKDDEIHAEEPPSSVVSSSTRKVPGQPLESIEELRQIPSWNSLSIDCWISALTVYTRLPGIRNAEATPKVLEALKWAQEHRVGNRDWIAPNSSPVESGGPRSLLGEILRIQARATLSKEVSATSVWIGRLTGDPHKPTLTMHWDQDVERSDAHCQESPSSRL